MPTGYTSIIEERDNVSFNEFVWRCARAFGALIMLRDDPLDAPVPERFEPSDYYDKSLKEVEIDIQRLESLTSAERTAEGERLKIDAIKRGEEWLARDARTNARYNTMLAKVAAWQPPTSEHEGLKEFMSQQLTTSISSTKYIEAQLEGYRTKAAGEFFADVLSSARRRRTYLIEERQKEIDRTNGRNEWAAQLRQSVPPPEHL
jgi:hypothetical protein